ELDKENIGTQYWNPFKNLVKPGERVFIKPNMIAERHRYRSNEWDYVITHGSVIRPIIDYLFLAMEGKGEVIIGDAPQTDSNFYKVAQLMGLFEIREVYKSFKDFHISIINLQDEHWIVKDDIITDYVRLSGDPLGGVLFDLGNKSFFSELDNKNVTFYGASYDLDETNRAHSKGHHKYWIAKSPIVADVFINIPKLKTHKKCGITINLKSLVGINANKNFLPHYIFGGPEEGGDQFDKYNIKSKIENKIVVPIKNQMSKKNPIAIFLSRKLKKFGYKVLGDTEEVIRSGNWYGNDTVWRMSLDLNKILMYGNSDGTFRSKYEERKRFFSIVDGIVAMEGNGPVAGERKECGVLIAGFDPVAVDAVGAKIMGFNPNKLKIISKCFDDQELKLTNLSLEDIVCVSNDERFNKRLVDIKYQDSFKFRPHFGWINHIEDF
ncbi:MAG: DUF362 domain-containing protein, partial [Ignavibacterium sp.]|nr:DUF362 domain-containing protein [Ignavibacterium sp.]MDW8374828.1 DUF362 domain-containing protein [Ignavibacteriales bacterium]